MIDDCFCQNSSFFLKRKYKKLLDYYMCQNGTLKKINNSTMVRTNHPGITIFSVKFYAFHVQNPT